MFCRQPCWTHLDSDEKVKREHLQWKVRSVISHAIDDVRCWHLMCSTTLLVPMNRYKSNFCFLYSVLKCSLVPNLWITTQFVKIKWNKMTIHVKLQCMYNPHIQCLNKLFKLIPAVPNRGKLFHKENTPKKPCWGIQKNLIYTYKTLYGCLITTGINRNSKYKGFIIQIKS